MTVDFLAEELHKFYRAAYKTFVQYRVHNDGVHDHGWKNCHRKAYFARRAQAILDQEPGLEIPGWMSSAPISKGEHLVPFPSLDLAAYDALPFPAGWRGFTKLDRPAEDVAAYDRTIQRWKTGNGVSRFIYYSSQRLTLEVVGLAAMRAARQATQAN